MKREDFEILNEKVHECDVVYLDNAATTQKPRQVIDAMVYAYTHFNANIHRGVHHLSQVATLKHEDARVKVAKYFNAKQSAEILFTKGTTDSINMLAYSLGQMTIDGSTFLQNGDEIVVSTLEHHSNIVPWQMLCERTGAMLKVIPLRENLTLDMDAYKALLSERTKIVSVAHVSNVLGIINPIKEIIDEAHKVGALVCIDAAQSAARLSIDVQTLDCDFLALSAHKVYGPTGLGVLYGKYHLLEQMPPFEGGGEMINHVSFEKTTYNTLPYKFEAGTPDFIGSYVFGEALDYIQNIGLDNIHQHETMLTQYAEKELSKIDGITIYAYGQPKAGVLSFNIDGLHPYDIGILLDEQGVEVRTGHHCAQPLIEHLGVTGTIRISFGLYNNTEDIDRFISALIKTLAVLKR